jgi:hypothetical protein
MPKVGNKKFAYTKKGKASAYNQIANRTGTMVNGTFVKDE